MARETHRAANQSNARGMVEIYLHNYVGPSVIHLSIKSYANKKGVEAVHVFVFLVILT